MPDRNPGFQLFLLVCCSWIAVSWIYSELAYIDLCVFYSTDLPQSSHHAFLMVSACSLSDMLVAPAGLAPVRLSAKYAQCAHVDIHY